MGILKDFKEFAVKGNVIDMAVGVIIGGAFGKIVTSLVGDVVMPAISVLTGKVNLSALSYKIANTAAPDAAPIEIKYGMFLQNILDFLLIAICVFAFVKLIAALKKKPEPAPEPEAAPEPTAEEALLTEIRDLLREQTKAGV